MAVRWAGFGVVIAAGILAASQASAQPANRGYIGGLFGTHHESSDFAGRGNAPVGGVVVGLSLTRAIGVEVEVAKPGDSFTKTYEGISVSFAPPGAPREEIERLGVVTRFTHQRTITRTVSVGMTYGKPVHPRWTPRMFIGVTNRSMVERSVFTPLRYPEETHPARRASVEARDDRFSRNIGALTFGGTVVFAMTRSWSVAPDVRVDYGSIGDEINNGLRSSVRVLWSY